MGKKRVFKDTEEAEAFKLRGATSLRNLGKDDEADALEEMDLDEWLETHGHRIAEQNPRQSLRRARRRNLDHADSTHQIKVHQHWRSGGASQWQRAAKHGQTDLFAHGIKVKNPSDALRVLLALGFSRKEARQLLAELTTRREPPEGGRIMATTKGDLMDALQEVADVLQPFVDSGDIELGTEEDEEGTDEE